MIQKIKDKIEKTAQTIQYTETIFELNDLYEENKEPHFMKDNEDKESIWTKLKSVIEVSRIYNNEPANVKHKDD